VWSSTILCVACGELERAEALTVFRRMRAQPYVERTERALAELE
jgi:hypothetical protein